MLHVTNVCPYPHPAVHSVHPSAPGCPLLEWEQLSPPRLPLLQHARIQILFSHDKSLEKEKHVFVCVYLLFDRRV